MFVPLPYNRPQYVYCPRRCLEARAKFVLQNKKLGVVYMRLRIRSRMASRRCAAVGPSRCAAGCAALSVSQVRVNLASASTCLAVVSAAALALAPLAHLSFCCKLASSAVVSPVAVAGCFGSGSGVALLLFPVAPGRSPRPRAWYGWANESRHCVVQAVPSSSQVVLV